MTVRLERIEIENFKGVRAFALDARGRDLLIRGANGSGKTTLLDAYLWCLFGRDSLDRADFEVKTLDDQGRPLPELEHAVTLVLNVDGQPVTLRRCLKEKWVRKRGQAQRTFAGNEVTYEVDGVALKKGEYDQRVAQLLDERDLRTLTDPLHFSGNLKWQERREILLSLVAVDGWEVLEANPELEELPIVCDGRSLADAKRLFEGQRREARRELDALPFQIREAQRDAVSVAEAQAALDAAVAAYEAGEAARQQAAELREKRERARRELAYARLEANTTGVEVDDLARRLSSELQELKALHARYTEAKAGVCDACGQALPKDRREAQLRDLKAQGEAKRQAVAATRAAHERALARQQQVQTKLKAALDDANEAQREAAEPAAPDLGAVERARLVLERAQSAQARVAELAEREKAVAGEYEAAERGLWLIAEYQRQRALLVEARVNGLFDKVRFKLVEQQVNGELADTCVATVNGVPYDNLNTAAKVQAGMEIIAVLQRARGVELPVWVDGRESVTDLPAMPCQVINLMVDPAYPELHVEVIEEAAVA